MKYFLSLLVGMLVGAAAFVLLLFYNPLSRHDSLSPLSVTDNELISLNYSAVAADALLYTNDGDSRVAPQPPKTLQLWEPPIQHTEAIVTVLTDSRNQHAGIGIKISSDSERTRLLNGQVLVDSVWHIYIPGRGSLFIEQSENHWDYLRNIVIPAHWSASDSWRGIWNGNISAGPGALGTARVVGGGGIFADLETEGIESLAAKAYTVDAGPVAVSGELVIELPRPATAIAADP